RRRGRGNARGARPAGRAGGCAGGTTGRLEHGLREVPELMASPKSQYWQWTRCRGRNGWDPPQDIPADMGEECLNVTFDDGGLGTKRAGCSATGDTSALSTSIEQLYSWVPGQDQAARELFVIDRSNPRVVARMAGGSTFTPLTV